MKRILKLFLISILTLFLSSACLKGEAEGGIFDPASPLGYLLSNQMIADIIGKRFILQPGFILVPANPAVGTTKDFYVAKYEMKNNTISEAAGMPWVNIDQNQAKTACNSIGAGYHLITNPEWMTIARDIENVDSNWTTGTVGTGAINSGHCDNDPTNSLAASTDNDGCSGTNQTCSDVVWHSQRRTHTLSNGEVIWDIGGNVQNWVDWNVAQGDKAYNSSVIGSCVTADSGPVNTWRQWDCIDTNISIGSVMEPITWQPSNPAFDNSSYGIGRYVSNTSGRTAAVRSGYWEAGTSNSAVFMLILSDLLTENNRRGFRCAGTP